MKSRTIRRLTILSSSPMCTPITVLRYPAQKCGCGDRTNENFFGMSFPILVVSWGLESSKAPSTSQGSDAQDRCTRRESRRTDDSDGAVHRRKTMNASRKLALLIRMTFAATAMFAQAKGRESELRPVRGTVDAKQENPGVAGSANLKT